MIDVPYVLAWGQDYDAFLREAWPLIRPHWNEVGTHRDVLRLDPDHERYRRLAAAGMLHILTARLDGEVVGYVFLIIGPHARDKGATVAKDDVYYVRPDCRRLRLGVAFIEEILSYVGDKAHVVMLTEKLRRRARGAARPLESGYLARFGFTPVELMWSKIIRPPHEGSEA
jgi:GNAT superfamily N-acetyltransferase